MNEKKRSLTIGAISGAVGGALGAVSGSNSWVVVACVAGIFSALIAWGINGMIK